MHLPHSCLLLLLILVSDVNWHCTHNHQPRRLLWWLPKTLIHHAENVHTIFPGRQSQSPPTSTFVWQSHNHSTKTHSHSRATQDPWAAAADWIYRHNFARQSLPPTFPARTRKSVVESRNSLFIIHATDAVPVPSSVTRASSIIFMILRGLTLPSLHALESEVR